MEVPSSRLLWTAGEWAARYGAAVTGSSTATEPRAQVAQRDAVERRRMARGQPQGRPEVVALHVGDPDAPGQVEAVPGRGEIGRDAHQAGPPARRRPHRTVRAGHDRPECAVRHDARVTVVGDPP